MSYVFDFIPPLNFWESFTLTVKTNNKYTIHSIIIKNLDFKYSPDSSSCLNSKLIILFWKNINNLIRAAGKNKKKIIGE